MEAIEAKIFYSLVLVPCEPRGEEAPTAGELEMTSE
jgi:hypothetical protein